jgi:porphobilinogen synthase
LGVPAIALFPVTAPEAEPRRRWRNPDGLAQRGAAIKQEVPELGVDGRSLDPFTTHGQDGIIDDSGYVMNDVAVEALRQGLSHADAGAMSSRGPTMDGRIGALRDTLGRWPYPYAHPGVLG